MKSLKVDSKKETSLPRTLLTALGSGKDRAPPPFGATLSQENLRRLDEQSRRAPAAATPQTSSHADHWFNHWSHAQSAGQWAAPTEAGVSSSATNTTRGRDLVSTYL